MYSLIHFRCFFRQFILISLALFTVSKHSYSQAVPDYPDVSYGPEERQWLNIYTAPSVTPTPVFIYSHSNGATADNISAAIIDDLKAAGISTVSWESLLNLATPNDVATSWNDAELMLAWVKSNANTYNFDVSKLIVGGSSRGTVASWKLAHSNDPAIRGLYMYNALPDQVWSFPETWIPTNDVTESSPPLCFVYNVSPMDPTDVHDPDNGFTIVDRYEELDRADRVTLIHSIGTSGDTDRFQFLVDFALTSIGREPGLNYTFTYEDGIARVSWDTMIGRKYQIQRSIDLKVWDDLVMVSGDNRSVMRQEINSNESSFYRIQFLFDQ
ncbi:MAG: hypothetical protein AAF065_01125 [Verrucomicrobiota bacterium]